MKKDLKYTLSTFNLNLNCLLPLQATYSICNELEDKIANVKHEEQTCKTTLKTSFADKTFTNLQYRYRTNYILQSIRFNNSLSTG